MGQFEPGHILEKVFNIQSCLFMYAGTLTNVAYFFLFIISKLHGK